MIKGTVNCKGFTGRLQLGKYAFPVFTGLRRDFKIYLTDKQ